MRKSSQSKRDLILDIAFGLFMERGYLDTKIIDIAEAAGIGKGTVYEYFSSKEALFAELLNTHVVDHYAKLTSELEKVAHSYKDQLRHFVQFERETAERFSNGKNFIDRLSIESGLFQNPILKEVVDKLMTYRLATLHSIITKGISKGEFVDVNPIMATFTLMGAISFFISYSSGLLSQSNDICTYPLLQDTPSWDDDEFFHLLLKGLIPS
jgi:AcrR family transcriptional regulator